MTTCESDYLVIKATDLQDSNTFKSPFPLFPFNSFKEKSTSDGQLLTFFVRRLRAKRSFSHFLAFACERNVVFSILELSLASETQFFVF